MSDLNSQAVRRFVEGFRQALIQFRKKHYELGGFLFRVREERIFTDWPRTNAPHGESGYTTWESFCEPETGYASRTCDQLVQNFRSLREFELDEDTDLMFVRAMRIGWSKLAVVMRFVDGPNNRYRDGQDRLDFALTAAEQMTEPRLRSHLAAASRAVAVEEARMRTGDPTIQPEDMGDADRPLTHNNPAGYVPYSIRFDSNESLDTFTRAVELIRNRYDGSLSNGRCASMMALHYLSTHARDDEGGAVMDAENTIRLFEAALGVRLQVVQSTPRRTTKKKASKKKVARRRQQRQSSETN